MATMALKDSITCPKCGKEMFPCDFDKPNRKITYKCIFVSCDNTATFSFDEVKLGENERFNYFCLNDDGDATWKCYCHGYCDYNIEALTDMDFSKFIDLGCILAKN